MKTDTNKTLAGSFKGIFSKVVMAATLAGAVFFATAKPAAAQGFSVQFGVGHPYYGGPVYAPPIYGPRVYGPVYGPGYGPGFYAEQRRHEEWLRHEAWVREHEFRHRPPAYGYWGR